MSVPLQAARIIEKRMRKLVRLQDALQHWRIKISTNGREWEEKNKAMKMEKEGMVRHYQHLKTAMLRFRAREAARLKVGCLNGGRGPSGRRRRGRR